MAVIISRNGKDATKVDRTSFDSEDELQRYIYENPESIPLYDIREDIRLLVVAREFPTQSGPIDAMGVDKDGELYIVETKLYKNTDKRNVVAQVLDYGASLWKHSSEDWDGFRAELEKQSQKKWQIGFQQKLQEFFSITEEESMTLINNLSGNLDEGRFKFVVLMDTLGDPLKDLILFINQNSKFSFFIAEMEYYKHKEYEILIPRLYGAEVKKDVSVSRPRRGTVTLPDLLARVENQESRSMFEELRESILKLSPSIQEKINPTGISFWWEGSMLIDTYPFPREPRVRAYCRKSLVDPALFGSLEAHEGKSQYNMHVYSRADLEALLTVAKEALKRLEKGV
ncbi:hypothetical protein AUJ46_02325 [Candidatus Peregrinibacteria bacterium CG1_02_54_53]|nr:MAG: hypothetical protein AUJ46_02325 [Candidatus Peregrinibacteria bacterium CG1_02_54_53]